MRSRHGVLRAAAALPLVTALVGGCTASAGISAGGSPPAGCSVDSSIVCSQGAGWSCAAGDNPELEQSGLSCSEPTPDGPNDDFCCFDWTYGDSSCTPDDQLTGACEPGSYGYQCAAGDDPTSLDPSLVCSSPVPDGPSDDFCCQ
ncbi:MAG: hypothetical protein ACRELB_00185 [Polyangiaceae bacterium]